jgi:hypothetical protein
MSDVRLSPGAETRLAEIRAAAEAAIDTPAAIGPDPVKSSPSSSAISVICPGAA